jgi:hypothetical protein
MACVDTMPGTPGTTSATSAGVERVRYFPRQLLTADDMRLEQEYFREKQRRHNRFVHGWGVVCGLEVKADSNTPLAVRICPGYALGPCGDEIYVPESVRVDLGECVRKPADPCPPAYAAVPASADKPTVLVVSIRYTECPTRPLRTLPAGCGCDDTACEYSRIRDGFDVRCRVTDDTTPATFDPSICDIEKDKNTLLPPWPGPPSSPWLDLAAITMEASTDDSTALNVDSINNGIRRMLYSGERLQHQVIACCCQPD